QPAKLGQYVRVARAGLAPLLELQDGVTALRASAERQQRLLGPLRLVIGGGGGRPLLPLGLGLRQVERDDAVIAREGATCQHAERGAVAGDGPRQRVGPVLLAVDAAEVVLRARPLERIGLARADRQRILEAHERLTQILGAIALHPCAVYPGLVD